MKSTTTIFFFLIILLNLKGQGGSDIRYLNTNSLDYTFIGSDVYFDFFNNSFHGKTLDTIEIIIDNKQIKFAEFRVDNGHYNWFSKQKLESIETIDEMSVRLSKFRLDSITSTALLVTIYIEYYDRNGNEIVDKSQEIKYWFDKKDIIEVLVKSTN
jgi:hypothetical protein